MSEQKNIFDAASNATGGATNPFATTATDPFGYIPLVSQTTPSAPDLCSQPEVPNPLESPAATPAGAQAATPAAAPIIDLGSQPGAAVPFTEPAKHDAPENDDSSTAHLQMLDPPPKADIPNEAEEIENPIAAAMAEQEKTENASIFAKPPIFEHGAVKEPIENLDQTFEDLRIAKADDFPELEDGIRVTWSITYGKTTKSVPTPKKTKIGDFKKSIENSTEFLDALKKSKDKSPDCIIKPRVTAQSNADP